MFAPYPRELLIFFIVPLSLIWILYFRHLWRYRRAFGRITLISFVIGAVFDIFAAKTVLWVWPADCCILPRPLGVPLEEVLFIVLTALCVASLAIVVRDINRLKNTRGQ